MQLARQLLMIDLPIDRLPTVIQTGILPAIEKVLARQRAIPIARRIAHLPDKCPSIDDIKWQLRLHISTHVYGEINFNYFCQVFIQSVIEL
jgi:hypothetical protein